MSIPFLSRAGLALLAAAVLAVSGCTTKPPPEVLPVDFASDAGQQAVAQFDKNGDKVLDYKELEAAPGLRAGIGGIKKIGQFRGGTPDESKLKSEKISADDINKRIGEWKETKVGRITTAIIIKRKGKALTGATVKLVPEKFLGPGVPTGSGTTESGGAANMVAPSRGGDDPAIGVFPGFYRVEVTKGSEIPAKYNTATTLGIEISRDTGQMGAPQFDLNY